MEQQLREIMAELFRMPPDEITDSLAMKNTEVWDSLKHMELITSIEQTMGVELTFDEIIAMQTYADIRQVLIEKGVNSQDGLK